MVEFMGMQNLNSCKAINFSKLNKLFAAHLRSCTNLTKLGMREKSYFYLHVFPEQMLGAIFGQKWKFFLCLEMTQSCFAFIEIKI